TGNYVATVSGSTDLTVTGSGEGASVSISLGANVARYDAATANFTGNLSTDNVLTVGGNLQGTTGSFTGTVSGADATLDSQFITLGQANSLIADSGAGAGVTSLNTLSGALNIQGNSQIAINATSPNISLSIQANSISDAQLAFNTGQNLTTTSTPTFGGLQIGGATTVTGQATILSTDPAQRTLVLQAAVGQTEDVLSIRDGNGDFVAGYSPSGNLYMNGSISSGAPGVSGQLRLKDGTANNYSAILQANALNANSTYYLPAISTASDTICLQNLGNCGGSGSGVTTVGALDGGTANANGASISGTTIYLQAANGSTPGLVSGSAQNFSGAKTFNNSATINSGLTVNGGSSLNGGLNTDTISASGDVAFYGTPTASATKSLLRLGSAIQGGNANGTYLGINADSSFAGDLLNLQVGDISMLNLNSSGDLDLYGGLTVHDWMGAGTLLNSPTTVLAAGSTPALSVTSNTATSLFVQGGGGQNANPTMVVKSDGFQTGDLFQAQNASGIALFSIASTGDLQGASAAFTGTVSGADATQSDEFATLGQVNSLITAAGAGSGVSSLNALSGDINIQGNTQIAVNATSPNISLSINANSIGDAQLAYNTGQDLTTTSSPTFANQTLTGTLTVTGTGNSSIAGQLGVGTASPSSTLTVKAAAGQTDAFEVLGSSGDSLLKVNGSGTSNWKQVTGSAGWSTRSDFAALNFNGKMWVMGGATGGAFPTYLNDVWSSSDGVNWTRATASAGWAGRTSAYHFVYDNKMWIAGGYDGSGLLHDVWYTSDGANWTRATTAAGWSARSDGGSVVFGGKMWVLGGYTGSTARDVWWSTDGANWTRATASAGWSARSDMENTVLAYNGKMWMIAGSTNAGTSGVKNDVWSSTDGITWTQATASANFAARFDAVGAVFNGKMWIMGGQNSGSATLNDVWSSTDGVTWTSQGSAGWSGRRTFDALTFNNGIYITGGQNGSRLNDVWRYSLGTLGVGIGTSSTAYTLNVGGSMQLQPSAAPSAAAGVMYFDSTDNKFKCSEDGETFVNCIGGGVTTVGAVDTAGFNTSANGATIDGSTLYLQSATATVPGLVNTDAQTFAGTKTFDDGVIVQGPSSGNMMQVGDGVFGGFVVDNAGFNNFYGDATFDGYATFNTTAYISE
ncbi:MAG TPA: hypothetical protein VFK03_03630, partial [Candidatus Saccharimonadales bacterium]|nr:hypothetical protein [Candidatus Saccharimonadales bacterium]